LHKLEDESSNLYLGSRDPNGCQFTEYQEDWRCPLLNTEQLYVSLRQLGVETQLVIYPGEAHGFRKPKNILDRIHRMVAWFEAH